MVRTKKTRFAATEDGVKQARAWFASSGSDVQDIANWDVKPVLVDAILTVLAAGDAIQFGTSFSGDAVSVTIYSGESKQRKWVADSIEFDDLMLQIAQMGESRKISKIDQGREAAD